LAQQDVKNHLIYLKELLILNQEQFYVYFV